MDALSEVKESPFALLSYVPASSNLPCINSRLLDGAYLFFGKVVVHDLNMVNKLSIVP